MRLGMVDMEHIVDTISLAFRPKWTGLTFLTLELKCLTVF